MTSQAMGWFIQYEPLAYRAVCPTCYQIYVVALPSMIVISFLAVLPTGRIDVWLYARLSYAPAKQS